MKKPRPLAVNYVAPSDPLRSFQFSSVLLSVQLPCALTKAVVFALSTPAVKLVWHGMADVCEGAPVAVSGWVLTDGHDLAPCAASGLHRDAMSVNDVIGGTGTLSLD